MEENKINRRARPRPYDLRRKVLLKNFLREQMTYIPQARLTSVQSIESDFSMESSNSNELEEDLPELNDENSSSSPVSEANNANATENMEKSNLVSDANAVDCENDTHKPACKVMSTDGPTRELKPFKFTNLMSLRSESKKKKIKGIIKAKKVCKSVKSPVKSKSFKTGIGRFFSGRSRISRDNSHDQHIKNSSKSLFSLFKSRRDQRKGKDGGKTKQSTSTDNIPCKNEKNCTSSQSVQTDDTWTREELSRVQESNKFLREENRLLSESLSHLMSNNFCCNTPLQSSNRNASLKRSPDCYNDLSSSASYSYDGWNPRSRILRSKSVQEHSDRKHLLRNNYRTRSMNCHNIQNDYFSNRSASNFSTQTREVNIAHARRKNILANLQVNSSVRVVQRRSSMPERILSENDRSRICRRSGSVRDGSSGTPFHSLPSEAFY